VHQVVHRLRPQARRQHWHLGQGTTEHGDLFVFPVRDTCKGRWCLAESPLSLWERAGVRVIPGRRCIPLTPTLSPAGGEGMERTSRRQRRQRSVVHQHVVTHLDHSHKAIALAVQRAQEARRPPPLPQRLAQGLNTGGQRLLPDKLARPQLREEFLLGHDPIAMRQEVDEHLKDFTPEFDRLPSLMQLMALGVKHIVAKDVTHRLPLAASEPSVPLDLPWAAAPRSSPTPSSQATPARSYHKNLPEIPRKFPEIAPNVSCFPLWGDVSFFPACRWRFGGRVMAAQLSLRRDELDIYRMGCRWADTTHPLLLDSGECLLQ
jgi:hypothetical protein